MFAAFSAGAEEQKSLVTIPAFSEQFLITLPAGWKVAYRYNDGFNAITKLAPAGTSVLSAPEVITIHAYRGVAARTAYDSTVMLRSLYQEKSLRCKQELVNIPVRNPGFLGYDTALAVMGCPDSSDSTQTSASNRGEMGLYLAIKGHQDMYVIENTIRGPGFTSTTPPINQSNYREYLAMLAPIWLCNAGDDISTCKRRNQPHPW